MREWISPRIQREEPRTMENNGLGSHWPEAEPSPHKVTFPALSVRAWATGPSQDFRKVTQQHCASCFLPF